MGSPSSLPVELQEGFRKALFFMSMIKYWLPSLLRAVERVMLGSRKEMAAAFLPSAGVPAEGARKVSMM